MNLDAIGQYSGVTANTPMTGFGGTSGFGSANYNSNTGGSSGGGGGFFSNFKFRDLMPVAAAGLGGIFAGRTADNYGQSMLAAQQLTADAALGTAMINANLGKDMARFGLNLDQQAAQRNLQFQGSGPFQKLLVTRANMGDSGIGFEQRAAARNRMFGGFA